MKKEHGFNLIEAWEYLQENRGAVLYVKFKEDELYGNGEEYVETLRIMRDHPYVEYHSGEYPSYFDQDDKDGGCLYDRHITGTYYTNEECK